MSKIFLVRLSFLSSFLFIHQSAYAEEHMEPPVVSMTTGRSASIISNHPGTSLLYFLQGTWVSTDPNVRIVENWSADDFGNMIGMRKKVQLTKANPDELYDVFAVEGGDLKMRRLGLLLQPTGIVNGITHFSADSANQVTITCKDRNDPKSMIKMHYVSPEDGKLLLTIDTTENGSMRSESYELKRIKNEPHK